MEVSREGYARKLVSTISFVAAKRIAAGRSLWQMREEENFMRLVGINEKYCCGIAA